MKRYKVVKLDQTCFACPSQWDAWDKHDNYIYIRFRHGVLSVTVNNHLLLHCMTDGDGLMSTEEMMKKTKEVLNFKKI